MCIAQKSGLFRGAPILALAFRHHPIPVVGPLKEVNLRLADPGLQGIWVRVPHTRHRWQERLYNHAYRLNVIIVTSPLLTASLASR
jgi:hypothetical protein